MKEGTTWVLLTDGNYIKIMFNQSRGGELKTLRDGDFENTSVIAYKMVTRKRALTLNKADGDTREQETGFFLNLVTDFLGGKLAENAYQNLVLVAPGEILEHLKSKLPAQVAATVLAAVNDDYLPLTQDKIQQKLAGKI